MNVWKVTPEMKGQACKQIVRKSFWGSKRDAKRTWLPTLEAACNDTQ